MEKNNTGAIFKNVNKKADNHPDYVGKVNVNNKDMEIALWVRTSLKGLKYMSVCFTEPYVRVEQENNILEEFENNETNLSENHEVYIKVEEENKPLYINDLPF